MKSDLLKYVAIAACALFLTGIAVHDSWARAGGSGSSGSRGSRTMSAPTRTETTQPTRPSMQQASQQAVPTPSMTTPSFGRTMLTAVAGGFLGAMLFGGLANAAGGLGGFGSSGIGMIEILLIGGLLFFVYRMFSKKREAAYAYQRSGVGYGDAATADTNVGNQPGTASFVQSDIATGLDHIRQMDAAFDETRFKDKVTDIFFTVQSAWCNRDLLIAEGALTDEMMQEFNAHIVDMKSKGHINKLDNIAVRSVEITEAWQESGQDFISVLYTANLLDFTVDEATGAVVSGSKTEPVKFEEYWTYTRAVGNNTWRLSAINQVS